MKCQVCNQESGEYTLCKKCFDLVQEEKIVKCRNCDNWYNKDKICSCFKNGANIHDSNLAAHAQKNNSVQDNKTTQNPIQLTSQEPKKENASRGIAIGLILIIGSIVLLCLLPILIDSLNNSNSKNNNNQNPIVSVIKKAPNVQMHQSDNWLEMLEVQFDVSCPDNYSKVVLEMTIYDKNDIVITQEYLTGTNYKKGNTYRLTYHMSFEEALKIEYVTYKIQKYE